MAGAPGRRGAGAGPKGGDGAERRGRGSAAPRGRVRVARPALAPPTCPDWQSREAPSAHLQLLGGLPRSHGRAARRCVPALPHGHGPRQPTRGTGRALAPPSRALGALPSSPARPPKPPAAPVMELPHPAAVPLTGSRGPPLGCLGRLPAWGLWSAPPPRAPAHLSFRVHLLKRLWLLPEEAQMSPCSSCPPTLSGFRTPCSSTSDCPLCDSHWKTATVS